MRSNSLLLRVYLVILALTFAEKSFLQEIQFLDRSIELGLSHWHSLKEDHVPSSVRISGGLAVGDINNDSQTELFFILGDNQLGVLYQLDHQQKWVDITANAQLDKYNFRGSGPLFFNYNQDEYLDLIVGSVDGTPPIIFENQSGTHFTRVVSPEFDLLEGVNTNTITAVDFDQDGLQDLFFSHWLEEYDANHFWRNLGNGHFECVDQVLGFHSVFEGLDLMHASNFVDINNDGFPDLLLCSDFGTSQIWINEQGNRFILDRQNHLSDENGMGAAVGDFDNDGDYDWFVTSIYDDDHIAEGNWGISGNKFYVNDGNGTFREEAQSYGLKDAGWGWGTSFADLNNDGYLDIVSVNGWPQGSDQFKNDRLKIFISRQAAFFTEESINFNLNDTLQGRGVSCLDYDNDGDLDIVVSNYLGPVKLWENQLARKNNYLHLRLKGSPTNTFAFGTTISVYIEDKILSRKIRCGSNYLSQNPTDVHFGLGPSTQIDSIVIEWSDKSVQREYGIPANQHLFLEKLRPISTQSKTIAVYPNPSRDYINMAIDAQSLYGAVYCEIVDLSGKTRKIVNRFSRTNNQILFNAIEVNSLSSGTYYAVLKQQNKIIASTKFIKL